MIKIFIFAFVFLLVLPQKALAQEFHLRIEPTVIQIDSTPPAEFQAPFRLTNLSNSSVTLTPLFIPIESGDDGKVILKVNEQNSLSSVIKERLSIIEPASGKVEQLTLRAGETKDLILFMNLVKGDPVGDYYFSVIFTSEGTLVEDTSTSGIPAGIGMNVLLSIGPKVSATAEISEFSTSKIQSSGPVFFNLKLKNTGKHLINPKGNITVKNMFGKKVADIEILPQYVLSNSERYLIDSSQASPSAEIAQALTKNKNENPVAIWTEKFLLGFYTASVQLELEENGPEVGESFIFFAVPVQVIVIISGVIFVAAGILLRINLRLRKATK